MKVKFMAALIAVATIVAVTTQAEAKPKHTRHQATAAQPRAFVDVAAIAPYPTQGRATAPSYPMGRQHIAPVRSMDFAEGVIGGRPAGCPHRYCGCEASRYVFGRIIPELNLAANWRQFPSAMAAPGMAAWRYGHVFIIKSVNSDGTVIAHDGNSGGGLTRVHTVSLRGYRIVDPNGNAATFSARKIKVAHR